MSDCYGCKYHYTALHEGNCRKCRRLCDCVDKWEKKNENN